MLVYVSTCAFCTWSVWRFIIVFFGAAKGKGLRFVGVLAGLGVVGVVGVRIYRASYLNSAL
jgi:hypothetical protein